MLRLRENKKVIRLVPATHQHNISLRFRTAVPIVARHVGRGEHDMYTPEQQRALDEAGRLFQSGDAARALVLLRLVQKAHPQDARVAYSIALCLEQLGQTDEAAALCDALLASGPNPRVAQLRARLDSAVPVNLFGDLVSGPPRADASPPRKTGLGTYLPEGRQLVLALAIVFVLLCGFAINQNASLEFQQTEAIRTGATELPPPPAGALAIMVAQWISLSYLAVALGVFAALYLLEDLPGSDFVSVIPGVVTATAYLLPFLIVPLLGWVVVLVLIKRKYEVGIGSLAKAAGAFLMTTSLTLAAASLVVQLVAVAMDSVLL